MHKFGHMHVYINKRVRSHTICTHTLSGTRTHTYMHAYEYACMPSYTYVQTFTHTWMQTCICTCPPICTDIEDYTYTHTHAWLRAVFIHMYKYACSNVYMQTFIYVCEVSFSMRAFMDVFQHGCMHEYVFEQYIHIHSLCISLCGDAWLWKMC